MKIDDEVSTNVGDRVYDLLTKNTERLNTVLGKMKKVKISFSIEIEDKGLGTKVKVDMKSKLDELADKSEGIITSGQEKLPGV